MDALATDVSGIQLMENAQTLRKVASAIHLNEPLVREATGPFQALYPDWLKLSSEEQITAFDRLAKALGESRFYAEALALKLSLQKEHRTGTPSFDARLPAIDMESERIRPGHRVLFTHELGSNGNTRSTNLLLFDLVEISRKGGAKLMRPTDEMAPGTQGTALVRGATTELLAQLPDVRAGAYSPEEVAQMETLLDRVVYRKRTHLATVLQSPSEWTSGWFSTDKGAFSALAVCEMHVVGIDKAVARKPRTHLEPGDAVVVRPSNDSIWLKARVAENGLKVGIEGRRVLWTELEKPTTITGRKCRYTSQAFDLNDPHWKTTIANGFRVKEQNVRWP